MVSSEFPWPRAALVTGGARRIGAALVRALADDGWQVAIHYDRSRDEAEALAGEIDHAGGRAVAVAADLADASAASALVGRAAQALDAPLVLLVNNASRFDYDSLADVDAGQWDRHMAINLRAPALLTQAFAAGLGAHNGLVVNLLDAKLQALNPDYFSYTVSKIGLEGLTELAARALAPKVRVCGIAPSVTLVSGPQSRDNFEAVHSLNALRRGVRVEEIVAALRFIVATPTLTAQVLTLDGGQRLLGLPRDVAYLDRPYLDGN